MNKNPKKLNKYELKELAEVLGIFERWQNKVTGAKYMSGGFTMADMFDYDDEYIDIELKWGVQSDCTDMTSREQYKLSREILNDKKMTPLQKANRIY